MAKLLIIDDDPAICTMIARLAKRMGHESGHAPSLREGLDLSSEYPFDLVLLDVRLPDGNGLEHLALLREKPSMPEVIIMTGLGDPDGAELAIRSGAWSYVSKPFSMDAIRLTMDRALQYHDEKMARVGKGSQGAAVKALKCEGIIGRSRKMITCLDGLAQAANSEASILIMGETGTGKELFAWAIHNNSLRAGKPFVVVDCAALPETLVESMLFGHTKGAFTGADRAQEGMIGQADGGTLLLDEVGELPITIQKAFLRVLQERRYRPLGSKVEVTSDFRLIAATNRDLQTMVEEGQFRQDLYFRLCSLSIELPPLRDRVEDLRDLATHHMNQLCERYGKGTKGLSPQFLEALEGYPWPGNVRELIGCLESALAAAHNEPILFPDHLPIHIRVQLAKASISRSTPREESGPSPFNSAQTIPTLSQFRDSAIAAAEKEYLEALMAMPGMSIQEACRVAGLSRPRLYALLKVHDIKRNA